VTHENTEVNGQERFAPFGRIIQGSVAGLRPQEELIMLIKRKLLLAVASAAAICVGALAGVSSAGIMPSNLGDFCQSASPDATIGLPGSATSSGGAWATHGLCYRYVVDVDVPGSSWYDVTASPVNNPLTSASCATLTEDVTLYWKSSFVPAGFTRIASAHFQGAWSDSDVLGGCYLERTSGDATLYAFGYGSNVGYTGTTSAGYLGKGVLRVAVTASTSEGPRVLNVSSRYHVVI